MNDEEQLEEFKRGIVIRRATALDIGEVANMVATSRRFHFRFTLISRWVHPGFTLQNYSDGHKPFFQLRYHTDTASRIFTS